MSAGPSPGPGEPRREILERSPGWWATPPRDRVPRWRATPLLDRVPRWLLMAVAAALLAGGGAVLITGQVRQPAGHLTPAANAAPVPAVCQFANLSGARAPAGFRVILGDSAVPPAYLVPQVRGPGPGPWRYGWKTGFSFRGGGLPVTISVPVAWRDRLALFGPSAGGFGATSALRVPDCPVKGAWNTYVSAFFTRIRSGCVPLDITAGRRTAMVWFGLGRHCPSGRS